MAKVIFSESLKFSQVQKKTVLEFFRKKEGHLKRIADLSEFSGRAYSENYPHEEARGIYAICNRSEITPVNWWKGKIVPRICYCLGRFRRSQYFQPVYRRMDIQEDPYRQHRLDPFDAGYET